MSQEPPKKKLKKTKHVRWDIVAPNHTNSPKKYQENKGKLLNDSTFPSNNNVLTEESETDLVIDTDREDNNVLPTLQNLEEEIEKQLEEKAKKNHLSVSNVKNILKAVITNKDVVDMVNTSLKGEKFDNYRPKFTRSKTKELLETFDLEKTGNKNRSEFAYILEQELSEHSSDDEEYTPNEESDEENKTADLLPESPIPDSPYVPSLCGEESGPENIENIGQRTRSKFSLSETPLETIEQQFIPPDITTDMYDTECDNEEWLDFLKGIQNPLDRTSEGLEDENDPEYNIMVEESVENIDFEELRHDRAVKVTKAELHALMNEWFGCEDFSSDDEVECASKKNSKTSPSKNKDKIGAEAVLPANAVSKPSTSNASQPQKAENNPPLEELLKTMNLYKRENFFTNEQYCLLKQQMQQHVQLLLQTFLLTYKHPYVENKVPSGSKEMLFSLHFLARTENSTFNVLNLKSSINLLQNWESYLSNTANSTAVVQFMEKEFLNGDMTYKKRTIIPAKIPPQLINFCGDSTAFLYPLLLPDVGVIFSSSKTCRIDYTHHENHLIALGLEQFTDDYKSKNNTLPSIMELARSINRVLMPHREPRSIASHVKWLTKENYMNPVKYYYEYKKSPPIGHYVVNITDAVALRDQPQQLIPPNWKKHLFKKSSNLYYIIRKKRNLDGPSK